MEFKITAMTYNVNKQKPLQDDIICWLDFEELNDSQIVCFALQEVPHAEMLKTTSNTWCEQLTNWMKEKSFSLVNKICLASNMLLVYLKVDLLQMSLKQFKCFLKNFLRLTKSMSVGVEAVYLAQLDIKAQSLLGYYFAL
uniref:Inositol polyphosphate-related phosphatase domain-containing protein n=1 Tax=Meloidogyne javanica TaxID=6303 RepID=A0A915N6W3_MELJA